MTSTWYAGSGGGSPAWENVDRLWDYVVGNTGNGPKAYGYNSYCCSKLYETYAVYV